MQVNCCIDTVFNTFKCPSYQPQMYFDASLQRTEINPHSMGGRTHRSNGICDLADDQGGSTHGSETTTDNGSSEGSMNGDGHRRTGAYCLYWKKTDALSSVANVMNVIPRDVLKHELTSCTHLKRTLPQPIVCPLSSSHTGLLPPLTAGQPVCHGPCWEKTDSFRLLSGQNRRVTKVNISSIVDNSISISNTSGCEYLLVL